MLATDLTLPIQRLYARHEQGFIFLGTCFAYRSSTHLVTAAHCIDGAEPSQLVVAGSGAPEVRDVKTIRIHPEADIALLIVEEPKDDPVHFFWGTVSNYGLGEDVLSFGAPLMKLERGPPGVPDFRLFKGYIQRFFDHKSHMKSPTTGLKYSYGACELNIPCPNGLSGGPIFRGNFLMLLGIVTENFEASTRMDAFENVQDNGTYFRSETARIIEFGTFLRADLVADWLNNHTPPLPY